VAIDPDERPFGAAETVTAPVPPWFSWALAQTPDECIVEVLGCPIRVLHWGRADATPLLFVHGNSAHSEWWSFIAPFFAATHAVAALDLSGMGDSGVRESCTPEQFAAEIIAVADLLSTRNRAGGVELVAHSFGGLVAIFAAHARPDLFRRLTILDTPLRSDSEGRPPWRSKNRGKRIYPSADEALARFRLLPPQDCENTFLLDYIARRSIRRTPEGWGWRFSANPWEYPAFNEGFWAVVNVRLRELATPVVFIRGEESSLCDEAMVARWRGLRGDSDVLVSIPAAHHHLMLDQPIALISALRAVLAQ
jgi:pimeloyl-ACP methyl ester carboxylesterase